MPRIKPKSLETEIHRKLWSFEHWAYLNSIKWKKTFRHDLIKEFREHITYAKNAYITGYEMLGRYHEEKLQCFKATLGELSIVESNMDHMVAPDLGIMSDKTWAEAAQQIDSIRVELSKLINSLNAKAPVGQHS